jgi:ceramide glucosyltransferase
VTFLTVFVTLLAVAVMRLSLACVEESRRFYRRSAPEAPLDPFTVIKPIKGLDDGLESNLRTLLDSDSEGRLQVIFALETKDDPAYPIVTRAAAAYPGRDVEVVLTGPSGTRMGKIHNMIEALPKAKHPFVIFSDADVRVDRPVLLETSRLFREGADAVYATPYADGPFTPEGFLMAAALNQALAVPGALAYRIKKFRSFSGAWMGFRRSALEKVGGLEPFAYSIVDDFKLGEALRKSGARIELLKRIVIVREKASTPKETFEHLWKWLTVVRHGAFQLYLGMPLVNQVLLSAVAAVLWTLMGWAPLGILLFLAASATRSLGAYAQDKSLLDSAFPKWMYAQLPLIDLVHPLFWTAALFSRRVAWRGKNYLLASGGRIDAVL